MAGNTPLGVTYYPSCVVNLLVRFDTSFTADPKLEATSGAPAVPQPSQGKALFEVNAGKAGSYLVGRIPKSASVELATLRKPGSFNLTFDYRDLPIDPRLVRAVGIEIFMDTVTPDNFAAGITTANPAGARTSQITPGQLASLLTPQPDNLVLKGIVDSWHVAHSRSGSTVTLEGRDLVGMLLNTPLTTVMLNDINLGQTIDRVVRDIISSMGDAGKLIDVIPAPAERWPKSKVPFLVDIERLSPVSLVPKPQYTTKGRVKKTQKTPFVPRTLQSARGRQPRLSTGADRDKMSVWDLITRYCNLVSAVPYFTVSSKMSGKEFRSALMIVPQWGLYDYQGVAADAESARVPSPFETDRGIGKIRQLMFGRNIEELTFERKYQGITARAVEVVSYDSSSNKGGEQRLLSAVSKPWPSYAQQQGVLPPLAQLPANGKQTSGETPSGLTAQDSVLRIAVKGVTNQDDLQTLANGLYEEIMRGETGGTVKTRSLASFGGNNEDPDLLKIRPRDPLRLSVDIRPSTEQLPNTHTTVVDQTRKDIGALQDEIFKRTGDKDLANAIAYSSRNAVFELQNSYRVNSVRFDWDVNSGVSISLDFHNYIMPRNSILQQAVGTTAQPQGGRATAAGGTQRTGG